MRAQLSNPKVDPYQHRGPNLFSGPKNVCTGLPSDGATDTYKHPPLFHSKSLTRTNIFGSKSGHQKGGCWYGSTYEMFVRVGRTSGAVAGPTSLFPTRPVQTFSPPFSHARGSNIYTYQHLNVCTGKLFCVPGSYSGVALLLLLLLVTPPQRKRFGSRGPMFLKSLPVQTFSNVCTS